MSSRSANRCTTPAAARLPPDGRQTEDQIEQFVEAGADSITIQVEATPNVHYALRKIRDAGCLAGLAINPGTPVEVVSEIADSLDLVLCMTVNPGWGGQQFIASSPEKVRRLRGLVGGELPIQVDGGISAEDGRLRRRRGRDPVRGRLGDLRRVRFGGGIRRDRPGRRRVNQPSVPELFRLQARYCRILGSPLYEFLLEEAASDYERGGLDGTRSRAARA